jgi:hypothetical protein
VCVCVCVLVSLPRPPPRAHVSRHCVRMRACASVFVRCLLSVVPSSSEYAEPVEIPLGHSLVDTFEHTAPHDAITMESGGSLPHSLTSDSGSFNLEDSFGDEPGRNLLLQQEASIELLRRDSEASLLLDTEGPAALNISTHPGDNMDIGEDAYADYGYACRGGCGCGCVA